MNFELPPVGQPQQTSSASRTTRVAPSTAPEALGAAVEVDLSIPGSPPPELYAEMQSASKRVDELHAQGRELHFERDEETGRIIVQVRDLDGNVIRSIPPSSMLDVVAGAALDV